MRLDVYLVEKGFESSRERARTLIRAGAVRVDGKVITKPAADVDGEVVTLTDSLKYVSRGGYKLEYAFSAFDISVNGLACLDIGASTGGFTDCLLQNGAARVCAVDVGSNQLDPKLRGDPRVVCFEQTDIREISVRDYPVDFITCDVSFISVTKILPSVKAIFGANEKRVPSALILIKPQFEIPGHHKNGIIREKRERNRAVTNVTETALALGFGVRGVKECPVNGKDGNIEYFLHLC